MVQCSTAPPSPTMATVFQLQNLISTGYSTYVVCLELQALETALYPLVQILKQRDDRILEVLAREVYSEIRQSRPGS